jgi:hypothetical protein
MRGRPAEALAAFAGALALLAACSGGGRGGDRTPPAVIGAAFVGPGAVPGAGDRLWLFFDEDVTLAAAPLDDADLTLVPAGALGTRATPPTLAGPRALWLELGAGVALTPGVTAVALSPRNDAVRDAAGNAGGGAQPVTVSVGDGDQPGIDLLTASGVDALLNGTGPAGGTLQVPASGFTIDLAYGDATTPVDPVRTRITADVAVAVPGGMRTAGADLVDAFTLVTATATAASYLVPAGVRFPAGPCRITAHVADATGMASVASFVFLTRALTDDVRPFETHVNSSQVWYLDLHRDLESYGLVNTSGDRFRVDVVPGANGRADLFDLFAVLGLHGSDAGVNGAVTARFQERLLAELASLYGGVNVAFTLVSPGAFPPGESSVAYDRHGSSQICVAGAFTVPDAGVLGLALLDANNASQNNNCLTDFQQNRLGVFFHTVVTSTSGLNGASTNAFRQTYDGLRAAVGGTAVGNQAGDLDRVSGNTMDGRTTLIHAAINRAARFLAAVVAHECGHSMGLVADGPMPDGLYGGDAANFPGSSAGHIRMPAGVLPAGASNLMSPQLGFEATLHAGTTFNTLNLAYLRERAVYNR